MHRKINELLNDCSKTGSPGLYTTPTHSENKNTQFNENITILKASLDT